MRKSLSLTRVSPIIEEPGRSCWDYLISGQSLANYLGISKSHAVTPLGWFPDNSVQSEALRQLRLQQKSALVDHRVELYVCSHCGDIGCGSVTVKIEDKGDRIVWRDFADQSDPEDVGNLYKAEAIEFDRNDYFKALASVK